MSEIDRNGRTIICSIWTNAAMWTPYIVRRCESHCSLTESPFLCTHQKKIVTRYGKNSYHQRERYAGHPTAELCASIQTYPRMMQVMAIQSKAVRQSLTNRIASLLYSYLIRIIHKEVRIAPNIWQFKKKWLPLQTIWGRSLIWWEMCRNM